MKDVGFHLCSCNVESWTLFISYGETYLIDTDKRHSLPIRRICLNLYLVNSHSYPTYSLELYKHANINGIKEVFHFLNSF